MPSYRNDTNGVISMLGLNVPVNGIVETSYYPRNDSTVVIGVEGDDLPIYKEGIIVKSFSEAISAGDVTKTSDQPTHLIIDDSLGSSGATTEWRELKSGDYGVSVDMDTGSFDGTIELQRKYYDDDTIKTVESYTSSTETPLSVTTTAFYRFAVTSYTSGTAYVQLG